MSDATAPAHGDAPGIAAGVRVIVEVPDRPPKLVFVSEGAKLRIGRDEAGDLVLDDANVSRAHAVLSFDGAVARVEDLQSRNGTWVDERRIRGSVPLATGSVLRVGHARLVVVLIQGAATGASPEEQTTDFGPDVVARDPATLAAFRLLLRLARSRLPVLLQGETGSGKEVAARVVHRHSPRAAGPFVAVNCATLAETLAEAELFGHEKGAFTGAVSRRLGAFEVAQGGTLFLDEVGELSENNQARLLRALQERCVVRVGSSTPVPVDVRVVAATNRDLLHDIRAGRFREDLYFRINGATVALPPLRARPADIAELAARVLAEHGAATLGPGVLDALTRYAWPGNVRELRHAMEHALALGDGVTVGLDDLPATVRAAPREGPATDERSALQSRVDEAERRAIVAALDAEGWNQTQAARVLGITRRTLIYRMERLGLKPRAGQRDAG